MVSFTKADLIARFPEFSGEDETRILALEDMARDFVSEAALGSKALTGLMLYTAHLLTMTSSSRSGAAGPVTSERVGDLSRSYGQGSSQGMADLNASTYGQQYQRLVKNEFTAAGGFQQVAYVAPEGNDGQPG